MSARSFIPAALLMFFLSNGCSDFNLSKALYDGVQIRNQMQSTPPEQVGKPEPMNYQQYESERKR